MTIQQLRAQIAALQDATMDENKNFYSAYDEGKFDALSAVDALLDSLQEEPVSEPNKELAETYLAVFNKRFPILPNLSGKQLADYKNFLNKCQQIFGLKKWGIRPVQSKLFEKLTLLWAAWGAEHLQGLGRQNEKEQDIPVSEGVEEAAKSYSNNLDNICGSIGKQTRNAFKAGAKWQKEKDESTTEDLGEYINELSKQFPEVSFAKLSRIAVRVAKWKEEQMIAKAIDAEVLENYDGKVIRYDETILDEKLSDCKVFDKVKVIVIKED